MPRFVTFEHENTCFEPEAMTEEEFHAGGREIIEDAAEFVWQWAESAEQARAQHAAKHDEWNADVMAGRPEKRTY